MLQKKRNQLEEHYCNVKHYIIRPFINYFCFIDFPSSSLKVWICLSILQHICAHSDSTGPHFPGHFPFLFSLFGLNKYIQVNMAVGVCATFFMVKSSGRQGKVESSRVNICVCSDTLPHPSTYVHNLVNLKLASCFSCGIYILIYIHI